VKFLRIANEKAGWSIFRDPVFSRCGLPPLSTLQRANEKRPA
jgi:hypothetical protein